MTSLPKILIVDDDHDTLDLLEIYLYRKYDIITAINGFMGLTRAEEILPALVMTDISMPVMDGIGFFNGMRRNMKTQKIPVIAITSFGREHTAKSLLSMGFCGVINKPPESAAVIELVERIMQKAGARQ